MKKYSRKCRIITAVTFSALGAAYTDFVACGLSITTLQTIQHVLRAFYVPVLTAYVVLYLVSEYQRVKEQQKVQKIIASAKRAARRQIELDRYEAFRKEIHGDVTL